MVLGVEDVGDHPAHNAAEQEHDAPDGEEFRDHGFAGLFLGYQGDGAFRGDVVVNQEGQHKNA